MLFGIVTSQIIETKMSCNFKWIYNHRLGNSEYCIIVDHSSQPHKERDFIIPIRNLSVYVQVLVLFDY